MDGTLESVDGRYALRFERRLAHPVEKVWRAITEPDQLVQWFPAKVEIELAVGGKVRWVFEGDETQGPEGTVTRLDPPRLLEYRMGPQVVGDIELGGETLRFELHPDPIGCRLVFVNTFEDHPSAASFAAGWHLCLDALALLLDDKPIEVTQRHEDLHEAYVKTFRLDEGSVHETAEGWIVRFTRQLMQPIDQVWAALTELDAPTSGAAKLVVDGPVPPALTNQYVLAGRVTAVAPPRLLEYSWQYEGRSAGRVRWELKEGPGGARIILTQTLPTELRDQRPEVLAAWHTHLKLLADRLRGKVHSSWPAERTEELTKHYTSLSARTED